MSLARARAVAIVGILVLAAVVVVVMAVVKDKQSGASYATGGCRTGQVKVHVKPLPKPEQIKVNVYNGTGQPNPDPRTAKKTPVINNIPGLAAQVADDLRNRGFIVGTVAERPEGYTGGAKLSFGPKTLAAASVVRAQFVGQDDPDGFSLKRTDDSVDVVLGSAFKELGSKTEVNQKIAQLGNPTPPPGTCDADA
jgi:LytR cell envelope-related transcriptional attenuator